MRGILIFIAVAVAMLLGAESRAQTTNVTLGWTPSNSAGVTGYYVYYGTNPNNLNGPVGVAANATNVTLYGLQNGQTYYFTATAHDSNYVQSLPSPEISATIGAVAQAASSVLSALSGLPAGQFGFAISGTSNAQYVVQASTDLVHWVSMQTNLAPFRFVDSNKAAFTRRFFRTFSLSN